MRFIEGEDYAPCNVVSTADETGSLAYCVTCGEKSINNMAWVPMDAEDYLALADIEAAS